MLHFYSESDVYTAMGKTQRSARAACARDILTKVYRQDLELLMRREAHQLYTARNMEDKGAVMVCRAAFPITKRYFRQVLQDIINKSVNVLDKTLKYVDEVTTPGGEKIDVDETEMKREPRSDEGADPSTANKPESKKRRRLGPQVVNTKLQLGSQYTFEASEC